MVQRLHNMPTIRSFDAAKAYYETARLWENPPKYGARKIDDRGSTYKSIRPVTDEQRRTGYAFRYHDTDVVVWWSDDEFHIHAYESMSTTSFVEALVPREFTINMNHPWLRLVGVHMSDGPYPEYPSYDSVYRLYGKPGYEAACAANDAKVQAWREATRAWNSTIRWYSVAERDTKVTRDPATGRWTIHDALPIACPEVDKSKALAASKRYNLSGFRAWMQAMIAMHASHARSVRDWQPFCLARLPLEYALKESRDGWEERVHANSDAGLACLREALAQPDLWWAILGSPHLRPPGRYTRGGRHISTTHAQEFQDYVQHVQQAARLAVYREAEAVTVVTHPWLPGRHTIDAAGRASRRWECERFAWPTREATGYSEGEQ